MHSRNILNIPGLVIEGLKQEGGSPLLFRARFEGKISCPNCSESIMIRKRGRKKRVVRHSDFARQQVWIELHGHKYECLKCKRFFNSRYPGISPWRRYTEHFRKEIVNIHAKGVAQSDLAKWRQLGSASIERWYHDFQKVQTGHWSENTAPKYLGLDEHSFLRKKSFASTFCDLKNNRVFDIQLGRSEKSLAPYLKKLKGKDKVEMINIDLSETYRSIAKQYFPNARISVDRFHIVRLLNQAFLKTFHQILPEIKNSVGLGRLLIKHKWRLSEKQKGMLKEYLTKHPEIEPIYSFKQDIAALLSKKSMNHFQSKRLVKKLLFLISELKKCCFDPLVTLGNTMDRWKEEIACMWRFTKNNSITEGFHRKMKLIQRRAYGFKNFDNYRLRVLALCGPNHFTLT